MTQAAAVLARVRAQLIDDAPTKRWSDSELLRWLSDGQRTIASLMPSAVSKVASVKLAEGTRQSIPADGHLLLTVIRNMGTNGEKPGRSVRIVSREIMDAQHPYWHTDPSSDVIRNYMFDPQDAQSFYVHPPASGRSYLELRYAYVPEELAATTDALAVNDIYITALFDYVMFRAHQKDSDFSAGQALANVYLQAFTLAAAGRSAGEQAENPNLQLTPFNPQVKGAAK